LSVDYTLAEQLVKLQGLSASHTAVSWVKRLRVRVI